MRANAPDRATTSLARGLNQLARPLLIERHRLQAYPLDRAIWLGMLERMLELRPRAVAVLDCHDVLRVAQLEALVRAIAERLIRASECFGLVGTEPAQQLLGVLAVVLEFHDVLLRLHPASASSGGERERQLDVTDAARDEVGASLPADRLRPRARANLTQRAALAR